VPLHDAYVGIGSNLGNRLATINAALVQLAELGAVLAVSSIYRTQPWGRTDQPWFANAVARLRTDRSPAELHNALKDVERRMGRRPGGDHWGPRSIDLDLLLYDGLSCNEPDLVLPHPRMRERAFVLVPLAEIDRSFAALRDALPASELSSVELLDSGRVARAKSAAVESETAMPDEATPTQWINALAGILAEDDVMRLKVERSDGEIELRRASRLLAGPSSHRKADGAPARFDTIKADLVGIFHVSRPMPAQGEVFESDREIGYIEALGIRTPVHSMGSGKLVSIAASDGSAVEYGQPLFVIARG